MRSRKKPRLDINDERGYSPNSEEKVFLLPETPGKNNDAEVFNDNVRKSVKQITKNQFDLPPKIGDPLNSLKLSSSKNLFPEPARDIYSDPTVLPLETKLRDHMGNGS